MRAAGIDCGTNSLRMLVIETEGTHGSETIAGPAPILADPAAPPLVREVTRQLRIVRLGQGVDATGSFAPEALARTFAALDEYAALLAEAGVGRDHVKVVATSAARDVANRQEFFDGVRERIGVAPTVISGDTEAVLSFRGAIEGLRAIGADLPGPILVSDIGGGSTECVLGNPDGSVIAARSYDVGCVRLRERLLPDDPPDAAQLRAARALIDTHLGSPDAHGQVLDMAAARTWIGVAGTVTSLMAIHQGLGRYDRDLVHGAAMELDQVHHLTDRIAATSAHDIGALLELDPRRAEVLGPGALILGRIAARVGVERLVVSETDILDGVAAWALDPTAPVESAGPQVGAR